MDRNRETLVSRPETARAALIVYEITKLLRLDRQSWHEMFATDVTHHANTALLVAYSDGLRDAYETAIIKDHCEFGYVVAGEFHTPSEYVMVAEDMRKGAVFIHKWKDSDQHFTPPVAAEQTGAL